MSTADAARRDLIRRLQELRRGNAAQPIPSGKRYTRKDKHTNQRGADDDT